MNWSSLLSTAYLLALESEDPSTQNAALLVDSRGFIVAGGVNEFPRSVEGTWERPLKYQVVEHAERNAIFDAARHGVRTDGVTMVCPWAACADCARAIIQAGVKRLVRHQADASSWDDSIQIGDNMMKQAGVEIVTVEGPIGAAPVRRSGLVLIP